MRLPIKARRLYITQFEEDMAETLQINSIDEDIKRFVPDEVFETIEDAKETLSYLISCYERKDSPLVYPIILNEGRNIGYVQAVPLLEGWEIGYHIAKPFTGYGYASEAVGVFLPEIMQYLGIHHIFGICLAENIASSKVLEKCGFTLIFDGNDLYHGQMQHIYRYVY